MLHQYVSADQCIPALCQNKIYRPCGTVLIVSCCFSCFYIFASYFCFTDTTKGHLLKRYSEYHTDHKSAFLLLLPVRLLSWINDRSIFILPTPQPLPQFSFASSSRLICATNSPMVTLLSTTSFKVGTFFVCLTTSTFRNPELPYSLDLLCKVVTFSSLYSETLFSVFTLDASSVNTWGFCHFLLLCRIRYMVFFPALLHSVRFFAFRNFHLIGQNFCHCTPDSV